MEKTTVADLMQTSFTEYPDVVSIGQMQRMLGISRHAAYDLVRDGQIKAIRIGNSFRILKYNIIAYMLASEASA